MFSSASISIVKSSCWVNRRPQYLKLPSSVFPFRPRIFQGSPGLPLLHLACGQTVGHPRGCIAWHPVRRFRPDDSTGQASPLSPSCLLFSLLNPCASRNLYLHRLNRRWAPYRANTLLQAHLDLQVHLSAAASVATLSVALLENMHLSGHFLSDATSPKLPNSPGSNGTPRLLSEHRTSHLRD